MLSPTPHAGYQPCPARTGFLQKPTVHPFCPGPRDNPLREDSNLWQMAPVTLLLHLKKPSSDLRPPPGGQNAPQQTCEASGVMQPLPLQGMAVPGQVVCARRTLRSQICGPHLCSGIQASPGPRSPVPAVGSTPKPPCLQALGLPGPLDPDPRAQESLTDVSASALCPYLLVPGPCSTLPPPASCPSHLLVPWASRG